ncbi:ESX-1 secretion-associated protein [Mycolicibacterium farcinogenes]|nr:ESX-1 secretion-associated protein [Mycolicibacterium farcinogenes]
MGDELQVDPDVLTTAGAAFSEAGSQLSKLQVDGPLQTAAGGVPGLCTADACRSAGTALVGQKDAAAKEATGYSTDLTGAAVKYRETDAGSGSVVGQAMPGS